MGTRLDILENDALKIAACDPREIEEHVVAVAGQILEDCTCPTTHVRASIADEDGLFNACHVGWDFTRSKRPGREPLQKALNATGSLLSLPEVNLLGDIFHAAISERRA